MVTNITWSGKFHFKLILPYCWRGCWEFYAFWSKAGCPCPRNGRPVIQLAGPFPIPKKLPHISENRNGGPHVSRHALAWHRHFELLSSQISFESGTSFVFLERACPSLWCGDTTHTVHQLDPAVIEHWDFTRDLWQKARYIKLKSQYFPAHNCTGTTDHFLRILSQFTYTMTISKWENVFVCASSWFFLVK